MSLRINIEIFVFLHLGDVTLQKIEAFPFEQKQKIKRNKNN